MRPEIRLTPPRLARRRMAGLVIPCRRPTTATQHVKAGRASVRQQLKEAEQGAHLDVITKDLAVTLSATLSKTLSSLSATSHVGSPAHPSFKHLLTIPRPRPQPVGAFARGMRAACAAPTSRPGRSIPVVHRALARPTRQPLHHRLAAGTNVIYMKTHIDHHRPEAGSSRFRRAWAQPMRLEIELQMGDLHWRAGDSISIQTSLGQ
eukprot:scaffold249_cov405-Prasinococcus_capsulatus_cf.AAC.1